MKKILLLLIVLLIGTLPFLPAPEADLVNTWTIFSGRFHVLLLHFPVVLVPALAALEFGKWIWPKIDVGKLPPIAWSVTLISCILTVTAGYLLYLSGDYQGDLVRAHLWGGVLLTVVLAMATFLRFFFPKAATGRGRFVYLPLLAIGTGLVIYTSHQGGSLTHGPEFLTEYAPALRKLPPAAIEQKPVEELLVFHELILPVLADRCFSCHNAYKTKGDLLLTSFDALNKGGKSGKPMLVECQPDSSELYRRMILPMEDDEHMPPPEKPAMSEDEMLLIKWWIAEGANPDMPLGQGPEGLEGSALLERFLPKLFQLERMKMRQFLEVEALQKELDQLAEKLQLRIEPDGAVPGYFAVSQTMPPAIINDETVAGLRPYAEVFSKISLPGALITDDGLYELSKMPNLERLYLPKTCIQGPGLVYLQVLPNLKELNLSYTFLDDAGALHLLNLPQLERVFLFGTAAESNVVKALQQHLPEVEVLEVEGRYY